MNTHADSRSGIRTRDLRLAAAGLLGASAVWSLLPVHPTLACPLRSTTGIPCPMCGMTRACVAAVHGDFVGSLRYNPAGILLIAVAVALLVSPRLARVRVHVPLWVTLTAVGALWFWNIGFNPTFHQLLR